MSKLEAGSNLAKNSALSTGMGSSTVAKAGGWQPASALWQFVSRALHHQAVAKPTWPSHPAFGNSRFQFFNRRLVARYGFFADDANPLNRIYRLRKQPTAKTFANGKALATQGFSPESGVYYSDAMVTSEDGFNLETASDWDSPILNPDSEAAALFEPVAPKANDVAAPVNSRVARLNHFIPATQTHNTFNTLGRQIADTADFRMPAPTEPTALLDGFLSPHYLRPVEPLNSAGLVYPFSGEAGELSQAAASRLERVAAATALTRGAETEIAKAGQPGLAIAPSGVEITKAEQPGLVYPPKIASPWPGSLSRFLAPMAEERASVQMPIAGEASPDLNRSLSLQNRRVTNNQANQPLSVALSRAFEMNELESATTGFIHPAQPLALLQRYNSILPENSVRETATTRPAMGHYSSILSQPDNYGWQAEPGRPARASTFSGSNLERQTERNRINLAVQPQLGQFQLLNRSAIGVELETGGNGLYQNQLAGSFNQLSPRLAARAFNSATPSLSTDYPESISNWSKAESLGQLSLKHREMEWATSEKAQPTAGLLGTRSYWQPPTASSQPSQIWQTQAYSWSENKLAGLQPASALTSRSSDLSFNAAKDSAGNFEPAIPKAPLKSLVGEPGQPFIEVIQPSIFRIAELSDSLTAQEPNLFKQQRQDAKPRPMVQSSKAMLAENKTAQTNTFNGASDAAPATLKFSAEWPTRSQVIGLPAASLLQKKPLQSQPDHTRLDKSWVIADLHSGPGGKGHQLLKGSTLAENSAIAQSYRSGVIAEADSTAFSDDFAIPAASGEPIGLSPSVWVQRKVSNFGSATAIAPISPAQLLRTAVGKPLERGVQSRMSNLFGLNFDHVRVHTDDRAAGYVARMGAEAFTSGPNIFFGPGRYQPETVAGQALIGHELTHVVQQASLPSLGGGRMPETSAEGEALERQALHNEQLIMRHAVRPLSQAIASEQSASASHAGRPSLDSSQLSSGYYDLEGGSASDSFAALELTHRHTEKSWPVERTTRNDAAILAREAEAPAPTPDNSLNQSGLSATAAPKPIVQQIAYEPDIESLAQEIFRLLKQQLIIEHERSGIASNRFF